MTDFASEPVVLHDSHVKAWEAHTEREALRSETPEEAANRDTASRQVESVVGKSHWPESLDLVELAKRSPQRPDFILQDWLPCGYATLFAGHGGVGKSAIALHLAVCIAAGLPFFGIPTARLRVLYLACEDRERVLHWRLAHICAWLGLDLAELAGWLEIVDLVGHDAILWVRDPQIPNFTTTTAYVALARRMARYAAKVLFVDGISDAFGGFENSRVDVKAFVNSLLSLTPLDGAVVLLGHVSKPSAAQGATGDGYSGSTQWHNAVRSRWYLFPEVEADADGGRALRTGKLTLELQKSNLGRSDQSLGFQWGDDARMFVASSAFGTSAIDRKQRDETERIGILRALAGCARAEPPIIVPSAMQGPRTALHVLRQRPEFPAELKANGRRFRAQLEALRQLGLVAEVGYRRADRHSAAQLVLTPEGCGQCGQ